MFLCVHVECAWDDLAEHRDEFQHAAAQVLSQEIAYILPW